MKLIKIFTVIFFLGMIYSCSNEEDIGAPDVSIEDSLKGKNLKNYSEYYNAFEYARLLSIAISRNNGMSKALETKCRKLKKNEGYYENEFFPALESRGAIRSMKGNSLYDLLLKAGGAKSKEFLDRLEIESVDLAVLMLNPDHEGFANRVYVDNGFDDMDDSEEIFYYENGEMFSHNVGDKLEVKLLS